MNNRYEAKTSYRLLLFYIKSEINQLYMPIKKLTIFCHKFGSAGSSVGGSVSGCVVVGAIVVSCGAFVELSTLVVVSVGSLPVVGSVTAGGAVVVSGV